MILPNEILLEEVARLLDEGREVELLTKGSSMLPFIVGDRDSVILTKDGCGSVVPGDIVLARRSVGVYILHRIVEVNGTSVVLRGDGNISGREMIRRQDIIGRVIRVVHPSGRGYVPGKARFWRNTGPLFRRVVLAVYRRTILKIITR